MNILIVNTFYHPNQAGGAEHSCRVLAESMARDGHNVSVVSTTNQASYQAELNGVTLYYISLFNVFWHGLAGSKGVLRGILWHLLDFFNPVMAYRFYRVLTEVKPDVVHTNNIVGFSCSIWWVCKILKIPIVHTLRDYYLKCFRSNMRKNGNNCSAQCAPCKCLTFARKCVSRSVSVCVGNSHFMVKTHVDDGYFDLKKKQTVIYNAWKPDYDIEAHHRHKLSTGSSNVVGFIGRIAEEKGVELLCDAFLSVFSSQQWDPKKKPLLKIAGQGDSSYIRLLKKRYAHERIVFLGKVKAVDFYSQVDVVVVPSLWEEPLARVVFEAFFFSVPVISSSRGGNPEIITNGRNGFIFSTRNDLEKVLWNVLGKDISEYIVEAFLARKGFETPRLVESYSAVYSSAYLGQKYR